MLIRQVFLLLLLSMNGQAQTVSSKEAFVNAVFENIVDSSWSGYNLAAEAAPCSFVKFDYDEWVKYGLIETVPLAVLNELAKNSYGDRKSLSWEDDKLIKANCISLAKADTILTGLTAGVAGYAGGRKKKSIPGQQQKSWSRLPPEQKEVFYFSRPVFTDDSSYAIIDMSYRCDSRECGMGATYLFRLTSAGWKLAGKMLRWKS